MLILENLNYSINDKAILANINFQLAKNEIITLFGPSGCGKTSILRLIINCIQQNNTVKHTVTGSINNKFQRIAYVFQEPRLLPWLTAFENVQLVVQHKPNNQNNKQKIIELLEKLELSQQDMQKYPAQLSGGMKQRVAFARALIIQPDLLLLDEAFSGLNFQLKLKLQDLIFAEQQQRPIAVIHVSHDAFEAVRIANRIYLLGGNPSNIQKIIILDQTIPQRDFAYIQSKYELLLNV